MSVGNIEPGSYDLGTDTWISIGCHRETNRLDRVLETFQKALTLAVRAKCAERFKVAIVSLHDHKGQLTAVWRSEDHCRNHKKFVEDAWTDEAECLIKHETVDGAELFEGIIGDAR